MFLRLALAACMIYDAPLYGHVAAWGIGGFVAKESEREIGHRVTLLFKAARPGAEAWFSAAIRPVFFRAALLIHERGGNHGYQDKYAEQNDKNDRYCQTSSASLEEIRFPF